MRRHHLEHDFFYRDSYLVKFITYINKGMIYIHEKFSLKPKTEICLWMFIFATLICGSIIISYDTPLVEYNTIIEERYYCSSHLSNTTIQLDSNCNIIDTRFEFLENKLRVKPLDSGHCPIFFASIILNMETRKCCDRYLPLLCANVCMETERNIGYDPIFMSKPIILQCWILFSFIMIFRLITFIPRPIGELSYGHGYGIAYVLIIGMTAPFLFAAFMYHTFSVFTKFKFTEEYMSIV